MSNDCVKPRRQGFHIGRLRGHGSALLSRVFLAFAPNSLNSSSILPRVMRLLGHCEASAGRLTLRRAVRPS